MTRDEYEQLYSELHKPVLSILRKKTGCNHSLLDELSQQVWLKIWRYRENEVIDYRNWIFAITRETIAGHYRRTKARSEKITDWQEIELTDKDTERNASLTEEHDRLTRLREVLPIDLLPVLDAWLSGGTDSEISKAIGIPVGSVAYHKNRVREYATRIR